MTIVFIENVWGSGQIITVSEAFKDHVVSRRLEPGENMRIAVSRFKSISIDEETATLGGVNAAAEPQSGRIAQTA
jgi:hypothetical protein